MPLKDYLVKEIDNIRDRRNQMFNIFFALISGSIAMIIYVITGDKPIYALLISLFGFVTSIFTYMGVHSLNNKIDELLKELKETE